MGRRRIYANDAARKAAHYQRQKQKSEQEREHGQPSDDTAFTNRHSTFYAYNPHIPGLFTLIQTTLDDEGAPSFQADQSEMAKMEDAPTQVEDLQPPSGTSTPQSHSETRGNSMDLSIDRLIQDPSESVRLHDELRTHDEQDTLLIGDLPGPSSGLEFSSDKRVDSSVKRSGSPQLRDVVHQIGSANKPSQQTPFPPRTWTLLHISQSAVFILYIVGTSISSPALNKAASIIISVLLTTQTAISIVFFFQLRSQKADKRLMGVAMLSILCLGVRVGYGMWFIFGGNGDGDTNGNVFFMAFCRFSMEFVVAGLFLYAGGVLLLRRKDGDGEGNVSS